MKKVITLLAVVFLVVACGSSKDSAKDKNLVQDGPYKGYKITPSGLMYKDVVEGNGVSPEKGNKVVVDYVGTLEDGTKFDSSIDRNKKFEFTLGGNVIKGWNEGVATMKVGGKRILVVPPALGYGARKMGNIPPNSTLIFEIQLYEVK